MPEERLFETYLGDGAYAYVCPATGDVWLYTSDGVRETNRVCLGPRELEMFEHWLGRLREETS